MLTGCNCPFSERAARPLVRHRPPDQHPAAAPSDLWSRDRQAVVPEGAKQQTEPGEQQCAGPRGRYDVDICPETVTISRVGSKECVFILFGISGQNGAWVGGGVPSINLKNKSKFKWVILKMVKFRKGNLFTNFIKDSEYANFTHTKTSAF